MKTCIKFLFLIVCCYTNFISAQSIEPSNLKYNHRKLLCEKGSNYPYSGHVEGPLSYRQSIDVANIRDFGLIVNGLTPSSENKEIIYVFYLVGELSQGKEVGKWQYYTTDKTLLIEADFVQGIIDGDVTFYYADGTKESSVKYKKGKANGIAIVYDKEGKIIEKSLYENGYFIKEILD